MKITAHTIGFGHRQNSADATRTLQTGAQIQSARQRQRWHVVRVAQLEDDITIPNIPDFVRLGPRGAIPAKLALDPQPVQAVIHVILFKFACHGDVGELVLRVVA